MKKTFTVDSRKQDPDEVLKKLKDPNSSIQRLEISMKNPNVSEGYSSEGWKNELLDRLWRTAKESEAGYVRLNLNNCHKAEGWTCRIEMFSPEYRGNIFDRISKIIKRFKGFFKKKD